MSFSDMMSSARGPGVIGTLMALAVLGVFVLLYLFVFDEGLQGGGKSIQAVIRDQGREIEDLKIEIEKSSAGLAGSDVAVAKVKELAGVTRENQFRDTNLKVLREDVAKISTELEGVMAAFEDYKTKYRAAERASAKGEKLAELKTNDDAVYYDVEIRDVTALGIQVRHREGLKGIAYDLLPAEMQDRFQFDSKERNAAELADLAARSAHDAAAAQARERAQEKMNEGREQRAAEEQAKREAEIAQKEARIVSLGDEIQQLQSEIGQAESQAAAAKAAGRVHIDRSGPLRGRVRAKENEIVNLRREIAALRAQP